MILTLCDSNRFFSLKHMEKKERGEGERKNSPPLSTGWVPKTTDKKLYAYFFMHIHTYDEV